MPPQYPDLGRVRICQFESVAKPIRHRIAEHQDRGGDSTFGLGVGFRRGRLRIIRRRRRPLQLVLVLVLLRLLRLRRRRWCEPVEQAALRVVLGRNAIVKEKLGTGGSRSDRQQEHCQSYFRSEQSRGGQNLYMGASDHSYSSGAPHPSESN